ncbi:MAG: DNA repair protein RecO [Candidatus Obscuribacterales bacterium]
MPTYQLTAINVGGFPLGESDKVVILFSKERGLGRAVAKGARKPGTRMAGKSEALCVNKLLLATGKTLDIITQAESIDTFQALRTNLERLTFGLYYAELTRIFGQGLQGEEEVYFDFLTASLGRLAGGETIPARACLEFEMQLLTMLGFQPELKVCVHCRKPLTEYSINTFLTELGGVCCKDCAGRSARRGPSRVSEESFDESPEKGVFITPMVWKTLVLAEAAASGSSGKASDPAAAPLAAAQRIISRYIEERAGQRLKALDLLKQL